MVVLVHLGLALLLGLNLSNNEPPPMPNAQKHKIIDAVAVDVKKYDESVKKKERLKKQAEQKKLEEIKAARKKEQLALEKKKAEEKKVRDNKAAEKKKLALAKTKKEEKLKKEKLAEEKALKEKEAKEKKVREQKAREQKERERVAAEKKRKAEEERKRRAEEKAEMERALFEEERQEEEARKQAERAARLQTQRQQYVMDITQKVENNWLRPVSTAAGQSCEVFVTQTMSGDVLDVKVQSCTSDNAFQRSVERAVRKASPLPRPPDPELFDREIYFKFKP